MVPGLTSGNHLGADVKKIKEHKEKSSPGVPLPQLRGERDARGAILIVIYQDSGEVVRPKRTNLRVERLSLNRSQ